MASTSATITVDNTAPAIPTVNAQTSNDTTHLSSQALQAQAQHLLQEKPFL